MTEGTPDRDEGPPCLDRHWLPVLGRAPTDPGSSPETEGSEPGVDVPVLPDSLQPGMSHHLIPRFSTVKMSRGHAVCRMVVHPIQAESQEDNGGVRICGSFL